MNNPLSYVDPSGNKPMYDDGSGGGGGFELVLIAVDKAATYLAAVLSSPEAQLDLQSAMVSFSKGDNIGGYIDVLSALVPNAGTHNLLKKSVREAADKLVTALAKATGKSFDEIWQIVYKAAKTVKAGTKTPGGLTFTIHAAERANQRGFTSQLIDYIVKNRSPKVYQEGGKTVYALKRSNWYDVIIINKNNEIITCVGGKTD